MVTVAVNSFEFHQPVYVGDLISCYAEITRTGHTSITVNVKAYAERMLKRHETLLVTQADLIYVAVGEDRKPRPLPPAD